MNYKKIALGIVIISVIITAGSVALAQFAKCGLPDQSSLSNMLCSGFYEQKIEPLFWSFLSLLPIAVLLYFIRREVFIAWAKFAAVAFPLMLAIMLYTYNDAPMRSGFGLSGLISNEQFATAILPSLFFLVSLIIIIVKSRKRQ